LLKSLDGEKLYLSLLAEDDPRLNSEYERVHARWIEGNPFDALRALFPSRGQAPIGFDTRLSER
jgi:hypothetical protein